MPEKKVEIEVQGGRVVIKVYDPDGARYAVSLNLREAEEAQEALEAAIEAAADED